MTVPLAASTVDFLTDVHNTLGPAWFRALAAELTAKDERLRMRDLGECEPPLPVFAPQMRCENTKRETDPAAHACGALGRGLYYEEDASGAVTIHDSHPTWTPIEKHNPGPKQLRLGGEAA